MPPKPPEKGIQSISSFFKPKSTVPVPPPPPASRNQSSTSQILYLDSSDEEEEALKEPPNKKRKIKLEPDPNFDQSPTASPASSTNIVATFPLPPPPPPTTQSYKRLQAFSYNRESSKRTEKKELTKDEQKRRDLFIKKLVGGIKGKRSSYLQPDHFMSATRDDENDLDRGVPEEEEEEGHVGEGEEQDERMLIDDDILFEQDDEDQDEQDKGKKSKSKKDVKAKGKAIDQNGPTASSSRFSKFAAPSSSKSNKTKDTSPMNSNIKYTPLEQQVIALKKANPGVLLAVEVRATFLLKYVS